jgi:hypothetical protein
MVSSQSKKRRWLTPTSRLGKAENFTALPEISEIRRCGRLDTNGRQLWRHAEAFVSTRYTMNITLLTVATYKNYKGPKFN